MGSREQMLAQWSASAARAGLATVIAPWLTFVGHLFVRSAMDAETAVRDPSLSWPWRTTASIRVAIDKATQPAELLTIHNYWTNELARVAPVMYVLPEIEQLVTSGWQRLSTQSF